jgi:hypothetical protein
VKNLSMHIMDILQNSIEASPTKVEIDINEDTQSNMLTMIIGDNGKGMDKKTAQVASDPFFTTRSTRKVGLGLSLLKQNAERTGGFFSIKSAEGIGTRITAGFVLDNVDRPVLGDIPGVIVLTATTNIGIQFIYTHKKNGKSYSFNTNEVDAALGEIPLNEPLLLRPLRNLIEENLAGIGVDLNT